MASSCTVVPCSESVAGISLRCRTQTKSSVDKERTAHGYLGVSNSNESMPNTSFKAPLLKVPGIKPTLSRCQRKFVNRRKLRLVSANFGNEILQNEIIATTSIAMVFAQLLKPITAALSGQGFNWKLIIKSGGMPSSHSAVVTSLATALCLQRGASDPIFGAFAVYACIVMYDAQGVRRAVGKQAEVLNTLVVPELARFPTLKKVPPQQVREGEGEGEGVLPLPPTAIGVELTNPQKVDLQFYENDSSGTAASSPSLSTSASPSVSLSPSLSPSASPSVSLSSSPSPSARQEDGSSTIGEELAKASGRLELAFVESKAVGGGGGGGGGGKSVKREEMSPSPRIGISTLQAPASIQDAKKESFLMRGSEMREGERGVLEIKGVRSSRSQEFWIAAKNEPSMREGEVVEQELGEREGWRHIPLKESVGHTKPQVIVGGLAGICLSLILHELGFYQ